CRQLREQALVGLQLEVEMAPVGLKAHGSRAIGIRSERGAARRRLLCLQRLSIENAKLMCVSANAEPQQHEAAGAEDASTRHVPSTVASLITPNRYIRWRASRE